MNHSALPAAAQSLPPPLLLAPATFRLGLAPAWELCLGWSWWLPPSPSVALRDWRQQLDLSGMYPWRATCLIAEPLWDVSMEVWNTPGCTLHPSELNPLLCCAPRDVPIPAVPLQAVALRGVVLPRGCTPGGPGGWNKGVESEVSTPRRLEGPVNVAGYGGGEGPVRKIPLQTK